MADDNTTDDFPFDEWTRKVGLNRKTTAILRDNDLVSKVALSLITEVDVVGIGLTLGQRKVLISAIQEFKVSNKSSRVDRPQATAIHPDGDGQASRNVETTLDQLITSMTSDTPAATSSTAGIVHNLRISQNDHQNANTTPLYQGQRADLDPLVYLANQNPDYLDIVDFVPQTSVTSNNSLEQTVSSRDGVNLVLKTGPRKPKLHEVDQAMYMAASSRILAHMLNSGKLGSTQTAHYLAYMVKIGMLAQRYQWHSVLVYDREYRKMQATYKFPWGSDTQHLAQVYLLEKSTKPAVPVRVHNYPKQESCRLYNHATCTYGNNCKFAHNCLICKQSHSVKDHPK
jgi:hypothetical protein